MGIRTKLMSSYLMVALLVAVAGVFGWLAARDMIGLFEGGEKHVRAIVATATELSLNAKKIQSNLIWYLTCHDAASKQLVLEISGAIKQDLADLDRRMDILEAKEILEKAKGATDAMLTDIGELIAAHDREYAATGSFDVSRYAVSLLQVSEFSSALRAYGVDLTQKATDSLNRQEAILAATRSASFAERAEGHLLLYLTLGDEVDRAKFSQRIASLNQQIGVLEARVVSPDGQQLISTLKAQAKELSLAGKALIEVYDNAVKRKSRFIFPDHTELLEGLRHATRQIDSAGMDLAQLNLELEIRPKDIAMSHAANLQRNVILVALAAVIVALGLGYWISRRISGPIVELTWAAREIGKGKLATKLKVGASDEIGELVDTFNRMSEDLVQTTVSKEYVERIVGSMAEALIVTSAEGIIKRVNKAAADLLGYAEDELLEKPLSLVVPGDSLPWASPEPVSCVKGESTLLTRTGQHIPVIFSISQFTDAGGYVQGMLFTAQDISELRRAEQELQKLAAVVRYSGELINIATFDGKMIFLNESGCRMWGIESTDVGRHRILDAVPEHLLPMVQTELLPAVMAGGTWEGDLQYLNIKTGRLTDVHAMCFAIKDPDTGSPMYFANVSRDITDHKKAEEALRESEVKYREFFSTSRDCVFITSPDGCWLDFNESAMELFGYDSRKALSDVPIFQLYADAEDRVAFLALVERQGFVKEHPVKLKRKSGEVFDSLITASCLRRADGSVRGFAGTIRDVTERSKADEALRESEEKLKGISNSVQDSIIVVNDRGEVSFWNPAAERMFGYTASETLGKNVHELLAPREFADAYYAGVDGFAETGQGAAVGRILPLTAVRRNGEIFPIELSLSSFRMDGRWHAVGAARDITERKKAEDALRESEQRYRRLFEDAPLIYVMTRHEHGVPVIHDCNGLFLSSLGYLREEVQGKPLADFYSTESRAELLERGGYARALAGEFFIGERELLTRGGTFIPTILYTATELDPAGQVIGARGMFVDITERKKAEEALRRSERLYRSVIENIEDVFYRSDAEGRLLMASPSGAILFGYDSVDEMIGLPLESLWVNPDESQRLLDIVKEQAKVTDFEGLLRKKDGSAFAASLSTHFYRDEDGTVLGTEGIIRDISERRRIEAQLLRSQKMEAMGTLAGGVAHEINNLLQVVLGHADMLLVKGGMDATSGRSLEAIRSAARNGSDLVNRILTFSRKAESKMRPLNLSDEVRRIEEMLRRTIPRMISLEMSLEENLPMISADPSQIGQILLNLAINARDAMPEGGRLVFETGNATIREGYYRTHPEVKPGKYVLLAVSDTGQGMDEGVSDHIFEPFFTTKQPGQGSGLGLSIVFGVVKSHGGHITCYSEVGVGSTFKILFPVLAEGLQPDPATTIEMPGGGTETLLLVDDEDGVRTLGAEMLEMAGYTVLTSANGREALEVYRNKRESISLVILDLIMPEMSGRHCLEQLLRMNPTAKVLVASGYAANGPAKETRESGATGFVSKPFDMKEILLAIRKCLDSV